MDDILSLFHHIHHHKGQHQVHHCGGIHSKINTRLDYKVYHCECQKHCINRSVALGHTINSHGKLIELSVIFKEKCPQGGWHIESGSITQ